MPGLRKGSRQLGKALRGAQARLVRHFAAIEQADPLDVHQFRVASRRIRSLLKTYRRHFRRGPAARYRRDLGRAARRLGPLRELDVLAGQPGMRNPAVARALSIARRAEVARLRRRLQATSPWRVLSDGPTLAGLGLDPDLGREDLERTIRRQWRRIERLLEAQPATPEARHALRIKLKNLRYALEAIEDPHDKRVIGLVASLRHAQDLLGADRDVEFACGWLEQAGLSPTVARAALRHLQRRSRVLAARRPALLRELRRAGHRWYGTTG